MEEGCDLFFGDAKSLSLVACFYRGSSSRSQKEGSLSKEGAYLGDGRYFLISLKDIQLS